MISKPVETRTKAMFDCRRSFPLVVLHLTCSSFLLLFLPQILAQDPPKPGHNEDVKALCRTLEEEYRDKSHRDVAKIMSIYQTFEQISDRVTPEEQKSIAKTIRKAFDIKPLPRDKSFLCAGAACLSELGKPGLDALLYALQKKSLQPVKSTDGIETMSRLQVREIIVTAIGYNKNPMAIKTLYKLLWDKQHQIIKAACIALSCYKDLPVEQRKPIVEKLIRVYSILTAEAEAGGEDSEAYEKLLCVEVYFNQALKKLTLKTLESAPAWREWYKENKDKKKW